MIDKNPRVSNSFKDFVRVGVQGSYQHYAAQIFQNFIKDSTGLFEKFLESNRSNPVNDSNYDELFNFTTRGFLSNQRTYGIKTSGITIPLDNSSNNVFASIDPVIPGFDRIRHFIYVDDRITRPKLPSTLFSIALEKFHINEIIAARNPGEENIEFCPYKFCDEIRTELGSINNDGCNSIIPVSYCIPTSEHDIGIKDVTDLVNSQVINVHTVLDKDDLYRTLLLITYSMLTNNELDQI